jgi:hypothetical protein
MILIFKFYKSQKPFLIQMWSNEAVRMQIQHMHEGRAPPLVGKGDGPNAVDQPLVVGGPTEYH